MTEPMTAAERNALLKLVARQARVAASDVDSVAAERYAEFERQATKLWEAQDLGVKELVDDANAQLAPKLQEIARLVEQRCNELGVEKEFRPRVSGGVALSYRGFGASDAKRRSELRGLAKAEIEASKKHAKREIERRRSEIEARILTTGIKSDEGRALLAAVDAHDLVPALDVASFAKVIEQ